MKPLKTLLESIEMATVLVFAPSFYRHLNSKSNQMLAFSRTLSIPFKHIHQAINVRFITLLMNLIFIVMFFFFQHNNETENDQHLIRIKQIQKLHHVKRIKRKIFIRLIWVADTECKETESLANVTFNHTQ